jgi:hypothetical protein
MDRLGIRDQFDILILSDHGHSTVRAHHTLREYLADARAEIGAALPELVTASDYIYAVPGADEPSAEQLAPLVEWLLAQSWADVVYAGLPEAESLPGVVRLRDLWNGGTNHRRPLLGVSPVWTHDRNQFGVPGTVASLTTQSALQSSHGSLSPYDLHCTFIAGGPSFKEGLTSLIPTGVTDILPTVLSILSLPIPDGLDGRIVSEALVEAPGETPEPEEVLLEAQAPGAKPRTIKLHRVGQTTYVHGSTTGGAFPIPEQENAAIA